TIRNSLIVNNSASDVSTAASGTVNQVSNLTGAFSGFVNAAGRNYHLAAGATAAIEKGNNAFVSSSTDLDRTARIKGGTVDYGAYEYGATNSAPTVANALADQNASAGQSFLYTFAINSFSDADNDTLTYTATLAGGGSIPAWLNFNAATRTFSGTPANGDAGQITVRVTATDPSSASVFDDFVVSVAAANVAPTLTNLAGDSLAYVEGTAASVVDQGTAATVSDPDSTDFAGGTLTVAITAGRDASEDVLGIRHQGSGAGQIGVSGSTVSYGGVAIGSFTGGSGSNDLVVTLNGSATPAAVQALVRNITYVNSDTTSATAGTRTLGFTLSDGDGGTSSTASASVVVSARPISLTSPSSQWTVVLQGTKFDPNEDQQANAGPDIVGGSGIGTLYTLYDDAGTTAITDDTLAFRVRIDDAANNQNPPKYIGYLYFGLDVDLDGDIDVFLSAQGTSQGVNLDVYSSGSGANASPNTTSIGSRTAIASFNGTTDSNFLTVPTIDSGAPADFGSDGEPDYFLSFKVGFSALKTVIDTMPINNAGSAGSAIGTALSGGLLPTTAIQYVVATATNANTFNADVGGYGPADNYSLSYTAQGAFSPPLSFANLFPSITSDGGNATAAVSVAENTTAVTTVAASDANGDTITYSISGGADQAKFTINAATGALAFLSAPDFEVPTDTDHDNVYQVTVTASDGHGGSDTQQISVSVTNVADGGNSAPSVANAIADQNATEDQPFSFQFAGNTFADADVGDTLSYTATLANGNPLPTWLTFNAATRTFSGTPANGDVGAITVRVTATDSGSASISDDFVLTVANVNDAPIILGTVAAQAVNDNATLAPFAAVLVVDIDNPAQTLTVTVTLDTALKGTLSHPGGGSYNPGTGIWSFSGSAAAATNALRALVFTPTANLAPPGATVTTTFTIAVDDGVAAPVIDAVTTVVSTSVNDAPTLASPIADQNATEDQPFGFQVPGNTFAHVDVGDVLSYTATLASGNPLPAWLTFNAATRTFSGTPANGDVGQITVRVTATDGSSAAISDDFVITVANVNDAPSVANSIPDQSATEDQPFGFQVPGNTFAHVDVGDALSYTATLASGNPLPAWLTFNAATRTFSGTPANGDVG
ncbi:MAG: putative Ig domain-containing protein, partial [Proteobacteria bacterium]|nr:putative Ig domain-containing protein [Pseudomonadota bacterium]